MCPMFGTMHVANALFYFRVYICRAPLLLDIYGFFCDEGISLSSMPCALILWELVNIQQQYKISCVRHCEKERAQKIARCHLPSYWWADCAIVETAGTALRPSIDMRSVDAIGRKWQCSSVRVSLPLATRLWAALPVFLYFKFNYPVLPIPPMPIIYVKNRRVPMCIYEAGYRSENQDAQNVKLIVSYNYAALWLPSLRPFQCSW